MLREERRQRAAVRIQAGECVIFACSSKRYRPVSLYQ